MSESDPQTSQTPFNVPRPNLASGEAAAPPPEPPTEIPCPVCANLVPAAARKCSHCGAWLKESKRCPECAELVHDSARRCRYCGNVFAGAVLSGLEATLDPELLDMVRQGDYTVWASPLGAMIGEQSPTALFFPPQITITPEHVLIRKYTFLGLRRLDQKLSTAKIASVRFLKGVIWGGIIVESYGGAYSEIVIHGLNKEDARETAELLEKIAPSSRGKI